MTFREGQRIHISSIGTSVCSDDARAQFLDNIPLGLNFEQTQQYLRDMLAKENSLELEPDLSRPGSFKLHETHF